LNQEDVEPVRLRDFGEEREKNVASNEFAHHKAASGALQVGWRNQRVQEQVHHRPGVVVLHGSTLHRRVRWLQLCVDLPQPVAGVAGLLCYQLRRSEELLQVATIEVQQPLGQGLEHNR
jgi:hypothetical protein